MNKWRYKVVIVKQSYFKNAADRAVILQEKLARLGMESWELVNAVPDAASHGASVTLYLKRPY